MKKALLLGLSAFFALFACRLFLQKEKVSVVHLTVASSDHDEEGKEQDGIFLSQQQDFENTKDIRLGYIPKERLIQASEKLVRERRAFRSNPSLRTTALSWTERGPNSDLPGSSNGNLRGPGNNAITGGRLRAILVDLSDVTNSTVWIGSAGGGVWKTTNITATSPNWAPVNDALGNLSVSSICQDPTNTNTMYFGTGEKTANIDAIRGGGIWKSTDHGVTWNLLAGTSGFGNVSRIICDASGNVYVATMGSGLGILRSTNGGTNWVSITPSGLTSYVTEMKLSSTGRLHIVCGYRTVGVSGYRYTDNPSTVTTSTWTSPATSFTSTAYNTELAVAGNTLYALPSNSSYETNAIWKSTNGGDTWATCTTSPPVTGNSSTDLSSGQGWYCLAIGVDPANANNVVVGGLNTYRSADGGVTWTQVGRWVGNSMTYIHADHHYVTWNASQVLIGTDGGVFYSSNGGVNWSDRNTGLRIKQFYSAAMHPTSANYFIAGAQDNGIHSINNAGLGASTEVVGGDGMFTHIDQDQPQYQFGAYTYNDYRRSTNSGASWGSVTYSTSAGSFVNPTDYDDGNNKLYAAGSAGTYVRWEDPQTGNTFTPITLAAFAGGQVSHVAVSPHTSNRVLFGTNNGKIVRVDNAHLSSPTAVDVTGSGMN
ncbi:MAG TPA: sialidase family protein, partial [Flavisolibacter sp.]|nr:sialidase family protein [Flavisolibacter sp.]